MAALKDYRIAFKGLRNGLSQLSFEIDSTFFEHFEMSKIKEGQFGVNVEVDKQENMMVFEFDISGHYKTLCDRCTAPIEVALNGSDRVVVKFSEGDEADTEEVMYVNPKSTHLELADVIYELIHVNIPIKALRDCELEDYKYCDQEALDILDGVNNDDDDSDGNPLWEDLRNIEL